MGIKNDEQKAETENNSDIRAFTKTDVVTSNYPSFVQFFLISELEDIEEKLIKNFEKDADIQ